MSKRLFVIHCEESSMSQVEHREELSMSQVNHCEELSTYVTS